MRSFVSILSRWKSILVAVGFPMALLGFIWWSVSTYRAAQIQADIEHFAGLPEFRDVDSDLVRKVRSSEWEAQQTGRVRDPQALQTALRSGNRALHALAFTALAHVQDPWAAQELETYLLRNEWGKTDLEQSLWAKAAVALSVHVHRGYQPSKALLDKIVRFCTSPDVMEDQKTRVRFRWQRNAIESVRS